MSHNFSRHRIAEELRRKQEEAQAIEDAIEGVITTRAQKVVAIWNVRGSLLYYPTFDAALRTGHYWLTYLCPACQMIGEVDLRRCDYHPEAPISALITKLSCTWCCPNPPFAKLLKLHRFSTMRSPKPARMRGKYRWD